MRQVGRVLVAVSIAAGLLTVWNPFKRRPSESVPASAAAPVLGSDDFPISVDVIEDALRVHVYEHTISARFSGGALRCWSYVSEGLAPLGQREIVFSLHQRADEQPGDLPTEPFDLLRQIHVLASRGQLVTHGAYTALRADKEYFGIPGGCGWLYVRAAVPEGVEAPEDTLTALLVRPEEIAALSEGLGYRVAALLGATTRYYPYPRWSERDRDPVLDPDRLNEGVVGGLLRLRFAGTTVRMEGAHLKGHADDGPVRNGIVSSMGNSIRLTLRRSEHQAIRESLAVIEEQPVAVLSEIDPEWDALMVWRQGWESPSAIGTEETATSEVGRELTIGASALILLHAEGLEDQGGRIEDALTMSLCPDSWTRLRQALGDGEPILVPSSVESAMSLQVVWMND